MARIAIVIGLLLCPGFAGADRIHLENGQSFDDVVILGRTEERISFRVASGEMKLPLSWVARIDQERGSLEQFLDRKQDLLSEPEVGGEDWLKLARWARANDVGHGFREALLTAGEIEPELDGLKPLMASIDYYFSSETELWSHGRPAAAQPVAREAGGAPRERPAASASRDSDPWDVEGGAQEVAQGLTRALERLAEAELERTRTQARRERPERVRARSFTGGTVVYPYVAAPVGYAASGWVFRGEPLRPANSDPKNPVIRNPRNAQARALLSRPPGSLLPVSAYQH